MVIEMIATVCNYPWKSTTPWSGEEQAECACSRPRTEHRQTITISAEAYKALCGLVQDTETVEDGTVFAADEVWKELRERFPFVDYDRCPKCGEREGADGEPYDGLCDACGWDRGGEDYST